ALPILVPRSRCPRTTQFRGCPKSDCEKAAPSRRAASLGTRAHPSESGAPPAWVLRKSVVPLMIPFWRVRLPALRTVTRDVEEYASARATVTAKRGHGLYSGATIR